MSIEERFNDWDEDSIVIYKASEEEHEKARKAMEEHIVQAMEKLLKEGQPAEEKEDPQPAAESSPEGEDRSEWSKVEKVLPYLSSRDRMKVIEVYHKRMHRKADLLENGEVVIMDERFRLCLLKIADMDGDGRLSWEDVEEWNQSASHVKRIDVEGMGITSLEGIHYFHNLKELYCTGNQLSYLDLHGLKHLSVLGCANNRLGSLDVCGCRSLLRLDCHRNALKKLDVRDCLKLAELDCSANRLEELNVKDCNDLWYLDCSKNRLPVLDIESLWNLHFLYCGDNKLKCLDVSGSPLLQRLFCVNSRRALTLKTLILHAGAKIEGVTEDRSWRCVPEGTDVLEKVRDGSFIVL